MIDLVGVAGSSLVVASLIARSTCRLRLLGLLGAVVYITYGLLLGAWPVVVTNTLTLTIHGFHLSTFLIGRTRSIERAGGQTAAGESVDQVGRP